MPDLFTYADYETSEYISTLLVRYGKLCAVPDCNQPKAYRNNTPYCYAHDKEKKDMIDLDTHYRGVA